ncbi:MAG: hypothetical protein GYA43_13355 [Bacteroidales bacterium]|nr:hypothetical protein [Bacteroidales bacterium]
MRIFFLIFVIVHALIHFAGFMKGFDIREVKELTLTITKPMGMLWLTATLLLLIYAISFIAHSRYAWIIGFIAVTVSQVLIVIFWKDARFGTLPNIIILLVSLVSFGRFSFQNLTRHETEAMISQCSRISEGKIITESDISRLPEPVRRWLNNSGVTGKPFISVAKSIQKAEMKMKPGQKEWMQASAVQYSFVDVPSFIWIADVRMNSLLRFSGRDRFADGKGEMLIKLNSLITVVHEQGEKLNEGALQRYLGEMIWFPSLALSEYITWQQVDDRTASATMSYKGTTGSGTFIFDDNGDFVKFSALRYMGNKPDSKRYEWVIMVEGYKTFEGIKVPSKMTATWKLEEGDWTWLKLEIADIRYNGNAVR